MENSYEIYTDGGARGNPGPAASAFVMSDRNNLIYKNYIFLGVATNNEAEYNAVLLAYKYIFENKNLYFGNNLNFFLDSELVVNQLNGKYKIKKDELVKLAGLVKSFEKALNFKKITYTFVRREKNVMADKLVNICIDKNI